MTDKVVRDELLRSHRFQRLSGDTPKLLFLVLLLSSDNLSNAEYNTTVISAAMGRPITEEAAATLLMELSDRDLVRPYLFEGAQYVHIPRSRQRIRYLHGKHPRPPKKMEDKQISDLIIKVGLKSDPGQAQDGPFAPEEKRSSAVYKQGSSAAAAVDNSAKWWNSLGSIVAKGREVGIESLPGESRDSLYRRVTAALKAKTR